MFEVVTNFPKCEVEDQKYDHTNAAKIFKSIRQASHELGLSYYFLWNCYHKKHHNQFSRFVNVRKISGNSSSNGQVENGFKNHITESVEIKSRNNVSSTGTHEQHRRRPRKRRKRSCKNITEPRGVQHSRVPTSEIQERGMEGDKRGTLPGAARAKSKTHSLWSSIRGKQRLKNWHCTGNNEIKPT